MTERLAERLVIMLSTALCAAIAALLMSCGGPVTQGQADNTRNEVVALCGTAMSLAPVAGPYAIDIVAACGTADVVADLATRPGAVAYLNGIIARIPH